jgi:predicted transcriptional regulator
VGVVQLRIVKRVPMAEVRRRVAALEERYGVGIDEMPDPFTEGQAVKESMEDYIEWLGMEHALRAYREGEDFDYFTEDILDLAWSDASKLTPRRMDLLDKLSKYQANSINDLASRIGRNVKNVYNDLKALEGLGFVRLVREGRSLVPELLVHEVTILLW